MVDGAKHGHDLQSSFDGISFWSDRYRLVREFSFIRFFFFCEEVFPYFDNSSSFLCRHQTLPKVLAGCAVLYVHTYIHTSKNTGLETMQTNAKNNK